MARLPRSPKLIWSEDAAPRSAAHDDVYFSADDGLSETRKVFLDGCHLPDLWKGCANFTIAETGFGTGLNFLALWQLWRAHREGPDAHLHFVSFEGCPLTAKDARRALSVWPELAELADQLIRQWPHRAKGVRRLYWPQDKISLTLHIGDIGDMLPASQLRANAWFLDGFSPAKNAAMWDETLFPLIAERSRPGARLATFTVAGKVRRALTGAGFNVSKVPGHGRKRERLEAVLATPPAIKPDTYGLRPAASPAQRIAILGAGIAGASLARTLVDHGAEVSVFDPAPTPCSAASGNPLALLMPRIDAADTVQARLLIDAYIAARNAYRPHPGAVATDIIHRPSRPDDTGKFAKILADPPLPESDLGPLEEGGLLHKDAMIIRPHLLIPSLLEGASLHLEAPCAFDLDAREIDGMPFDTIILANGIALRDICPWLGIVPKQGQIDYLENAENHAPAALVAGHYALAEGAIRVWGASYEAHEGAALVSDTAKAANLAGLRTLAPGWLGAATPETAHSRASIRATLPDSLPVIGALPDEQAARTCFADLQTGKLADTDAPLTEGVYVAGAFGSRGFTWGPWAASIIASQLYAAPSPAPVKALEAVSPMRVIIRALKRGA